ncbi:unnamed protein product, partial [Durusdinium trenchii]
HHRGGPVRGRLLRRDGAGRRRTVAGVEHGEDRELRASALWTATRGARGMDVEWTC